MTEEVKWAHPGALGLGGFGFTTILLQLHNLGLIANIEPLLWGFFWGGAAQVTAGIVDGRRGDTFGMTAFVSYGFFWIGLSFMFLMEWLGVVELSGAGLGWTCILWGVFTAYMTVGAFKISRLHVLVFTTLTVLFGMLAVVFFGGLSPKAAGVMGLVCGSAAVYGSAAVVLNATYGRWVLPIGRLS